MLNGRNDWCENKRGIFLDSHFNKDLKKLEWRNFFNDTRKQFIHSPNTNSIFVKKDSMIIKKIPKVNFQRQATILKLTVRGPDHIEDPNSWKINASSNWFRFFMMKCSDGNIYIKFN